MAIPNMFTVRMHAQRVLRHRLDGIVDAVEPGGGDMYEGLDTEEREALVEVTRMGFPPRSWFGHRTMGMHAFPLLYGGLVMADPSYFEDFWTVPGYLGHEPPASLRRDIVQHRCEVVAMITDREAADLGLSVGRQPGQSRGGVDTAWHEADGAPAVQVAVRLTSPPAVDILGAELVVTSGAAAGARLRAPHRRGRHRDLRSGQHRGHGATATGRRRRDRQPRLPRGPDVPPSPGAESRLLRLGSVRDPDGSPIHPQRPLLLGPLFAAAAGTVQTGRFEGKMIVVESLLDREALPWQADWYRTKVQEHLGAATDDHFRVWFVDNALHGDDEIQESPTHTISYLGVLHQALRDLSAWVEKGTAHQRARATRSSTARSWCPARPGRCSRSSRSPPMVTSGPTWRSGTMSPSAPWPRFPTAPGRSCSSSGTSTGPATSRSRSPWTARRVVVERRHSFSAPGTHFATVRVVSRRDGDATTAYARIQNLARARIVVT